MSVGFQILNNIIPAWWLPVRSLICLRERHLCRRCCCCCCRERLRVVLDTPTRNQQSSGTCTVDDGPCLSPPRSPHLLTARNHRSHIEYSYHIVSPENNFVVAMCLECQSVTELKRNNSIRGRTIPNNLNDLKVYTIFQ